MIYKGNYFNKEMRQVYQEYGAGTIRRITFSLFLGLVSFSIHFTLQTLQESVLIDTVPEVMQASYFSTIYTYIHLSLILIVLYFIFNYGSLFFHEIGKNSWYLLAKMGYNPSIMLFSKLVAILLSTIFVYTVGFIFTILLTFFLRYNLVTAYFPALYLSGLIDLIIISIVSMMLSSFINTLAYARLSVLCSTILLMVLKYKTNYYHIISNRVTMQNFYELFNLQRSLFLPISGVIILTCILICIARVEHISKYYNLAYESYDDVLPSDVSVSLVDPVTKDKKPLVDRAKIEGRRRFFDMAFTSFLIIFIFLALSFNVMVLLISASTTGREVSIHGTIPYIFKSNTMEPTIKLNDLAYFKKIDSDQEIEVGEIVLFEDDYITYVERVIDKDGELYKVDIDKYPAMSQPGAMIKSVKKDAIHGVYSGRNRWLGVLILFANTIIGRLVLLLLPAFLLLYQKPLTDRLFQKE